MLVGPTGVGKTTTTALVGAIVRAAGLPVEVAGNIGRPLASLVGSADELRANPQYTNQEAYGRLRQEVFPIQEKCATGIYG